MDIYNNLEYGGLCSLSDSNEDFSEDLGDFSLYIINFAGRISEAAMGGAGWAQRPALRDKEPKKTGVRSARAHTLGKTPLVYNNLRI